MSKTLSLLKAAQASRAAKYTHAITKETASQGLSGSFALASSASVPNQEAFIQDSHNKAAWPAALFVSLAFALIVALNLALFIAMQNNFSKTSSIVTKLQNIEKSLDKYTEQINGISASVKQADQEAKKANQKIEENNRKLTQLEKTNEGNAAAVENLTKAKNTLFNKTAALEAELGKLKSATP